MALVDPGPPGPAAVRGDGTISVGERDVLRLGDEDGEVVVARHDDLWVAEVDGQRVSVAQGTTLEVGFDLWTVLLPVERRGVFSTVGEQPEQDVELILDVSEDGEDVRRATVVVDGIHRALPIRSHLQLVLTLAQRRLHDEARGVPEAERGWLSTDHLARQVPVEPHLLATHVHRTRKQFAEAGVDDAQSTIEARGRPPNREIRLARVRPTVHVRSS